MITCGSQKSHNSKLWFKKQLMLYDLLQSSPWKRNSSDQPCIHVMYSNLQVHPQSVWVQPPAMPTEEKRYACSTDYQLPKAQLVDKPASLQSSVLSFQACRAQMSLNCSMKQTFITHLTVELVLTTSSRFKIC